MRSVARVLRLPSFAYLTRVVSGSSSTRFSGVAWLLAGHFGTRAVLSLKLFLAARWLGPEAIGLAATATLVLSVADALTETGLNQALVRSPRHLSQLRTGAVLTLQMSRGLLLCSALLLLAAPIAAALRTPQASSLIALIGLVPLIRGAASPGLPILVKERRFAVSGAIDVSCAAVDFVVTCVLLHNIKSPIGIVVGSVVAELTRFSLSWIAARKPVKPTFAWRVVKDLTGFGRWIWTGTILTLITNQLDKVLVARLLGPADLGIYQLASKIAQLPLADASAAYSQYLLPKMARECRENYGQAKATLRRTFLVVLLVTFVLGISLGLAADKFIPLLFGAQWAASAHMVKMLTIPMGVGALIVPVVCFHKARGTPRKVAKANFLQLSVLAILAPVLTAYLGLDGLVISLALAGALALLVLAIEAREGSYVP